MSKIYKFFSLLLVAFLAAVGAKAQQSITSLDEVENSSAYTIQSYDRGYMIYAPEKAADAAWCSGNGNVAVSSDDPNCQWVFFQTEHGCYLYNLGAERFLYKSGSGTQFTESPQSYDVTLIPSTGANAATHPVVVAFGTNQINLHVSQNPSVLTNWNGTADPGNTMSIVPVVTDLPDDVLAPIKEKVGVYESTVEWPIKSLSETENSKTYRITNPRGNWSYDPAFTYTDENTGNTSSGTEMLVSRGVAGASATLDDANEEFVFLKTIHGFYRLYSPVAQKFVNLGTRSDLDYGYAALGDAPVLADTIKGLTSNSASHPLVLAMNNQFGVSTNYKGCGGIINGYNDLSDEGNCVAIVESISEFNPTELLAAVAEVEAPSLLPTSVTPANGSALPSVLERIDLTFDKPLDFVNYNIAFYLTNEAGEQLCMMYPEQTAENAFCLMPWDASNLCTTTYKFTEPGTYSVVVPTYSVMNNFDWEADDPFDPMTGVFYNPEFTVSFTVDFLEPTTVEPASESQVHELSSFTLTFPEGVTYDENVAVTLSNRAAGVALTPAVAVDGATVTLTLDEPVSEVGNYVLVVPAGAFTAESGMYNTNLSYYYTLLPEPDSFVYTEMSPADSACVTSLSDVSIYYDDTTTLLPLAATTPLSVVNTETDETVTQAVLDYDEEDYNMVHLLFAEEVNTPGTYSVTVPEKMVWNSLANFDEDDFGVSMGAVYNPAFTYTFTVVEPLQVVSLTPEDGVQESGVLPSQVVVTFNKPIEMPTYVACRNNMSFRGTNLLAVEGAVVVEDKVLTINLPESVTENATGLILNVEGTDVDGLPMAYGEETDAISLVYEVVLPSDRFEFGSSNPENGSTVDFLSSVVVTMASPYEDDFVGGFDPSKEVVVKNAEGETVTTASLDFDRDTNDGWNQNFIITLAETVKTPGTYTITVPEATAFNNNYADSFEDFGVSSFGAIYNPEFTLTFTVAEQTGISNIAVDATSGEAYTLDGRKVTGKLQRGVYIINHKKVYVK